MSQKQEKKLRKQLRLESKGMWARTAGTQAARAKAYKVTLLVGLPVVLISLIANVIMGIHIAIG